MKKLSIESIFFLFIFIFFSFFSFMYGLFENELMGYVSAIVFNILSLISYCFLKNKTIFFGVLLIYLLMFNLSLFVGDNELYYNQVYSNLTPYLVLPILCFLLLIPLIFIRRPDLKVIIDSPITLYFCIFLSPFIIYSLWYLIPYTSTTLAMGAKDVRTSLAENSMLPSGIMTTLSVGVSLFYPLFIFLMFYCFVKRINKIILIIMFLGIVCGIVGAIIFAARDRFLWIPLLFLINYWLWYPYLTSKIKRIIKLIIGFLGLLFLFGLILFTISRFSESNTGVLGSILLYFGAQPYIFSETVIRHTPDLYYGLNLRFPFFLEIIGLNLEPTVRDTPYQWMFGTLFSDFYLMGGWFYCFLLILLMNSFYIYIYKFNLNNPWLYIILMLLHVQVLAQGVFFFSFGFPGGNFYILLTLILAVSMNILSRFRVN